MGYPLFGAAHLLSVGIALCLVVLLICGIRKLEDKQQRRVMSVLPILMVLLEIFKDAFLVRAGRFGIGYLPLHVCSIGIFIFLLREFLPWDRAKEIFGEIAFVLIMPASIAALLFADWTISYPVLNFMNLYSYVWHGALVLYPALLMARGDVKPSIRHIHYVLLFFCVVVPAIYAFDKRFGCNYFFVNWPVPNSPLSWMESFMGNPGYLVGYGGLTLAVILMVYLWGYLMFFKKKSKVEKKTYDAESKKPVIKASICNGEQVAGFQDIHTGAFEEVMLIRDSEDLFRFKDEYGISGEIEKIY